MEEKMDGWLSDIFKRNAKDIHKYAATTLWSVTKWVKNFNANRTNFFTLKMFVT